MDMAILTATPITPDINSRCTGSKCRSGMSWSRSADAAAWTRSGLRRVLAAAERECARIQRRERGIDE